MRRMPSEQGDQFGHEGYGHQGKARGRGAIVGARLQTMGNGSELAVQREAERETGRLVAFSDGVMAVIITIMAFELRSPLGGTFTALRARLPELFVYVLSFAFIGIYWNNHHHLLRASRRCSGAMMWANLHLLFWLSLVPVLTEWVGKDYKDSAPAAVYGLVALCSAVAWTLLQTAIIRADGPSSAVARAIGSDLKGRVSLVTYAAAVGLAFVTPWIAYGCFVFVSVVWFVPDRRLARAEGGRRSALSDRGVI